MLRWRSSSAIPMLGDETRPGDGAQDVGLVVRLQLDLMQGWDDFLPQ
jgi:hypothetical protein